MERLERGGSCGRRIAGDTIALLCAMNTKPWIISDRIMFPHIRHDLVLHFPQTSNFIFSVQMEVDIFWNAFSSVPFLNSKKAFINDPKQKRN